MTEKPPSQRQAETAVGGIQEALLMAVSCLPLICLQHISGGDEGRGANNTPGSNSTAF